MDFITPENCQKKFNISRRTFFNWLKNGKFETKYIPSAKGGGNKGQQLLVRPKNEPAKNQTPGKINPERYRVNPGEPGNSVVTEFRNAIPVAVTSNAEEAGRVVDQLIKDRKALSFQREELIDQILKPRTEDNQPPIDPEAPGASHLQAFTPLKVQVGPGALVVESNPGDSPHSTNLPLVGSVNRDGPRASRIANLRYALIQAFNEEIKKNHRPRTEIVRDFLSLYNTGVSHPEIHRELGAIARSTLYELLRAEDLGGVDALVPQYGGMGSSKITEHEKNLLLTLVLHQNRLKTAYAITLTKNYLAKKRIESPSSPATLRRFVDQFQKEHYDLWTFKREGEKALNDKVLPYAERDSRLLEVGAGLVADGHRLNFQVIHPDTGKPCRAALVLFWDWKSSYPLGWEIMLEENIQCVASALRNAILTLGKTPKWVLLDNGKAFKAKIFTEDLNFEDSELPGMFARLNINYHFAQAYNAKAKPIERIFGILNEQLERLLPSYTGASIEDKPAWTKRNEKYARSLHNPYVPTIQETNDLIRAWRDRYADTPSRGRDDQRPVDIFNQGKGPGVDPNELTYLMMDREIKHVHRNGVTWLGWHWYDEALYGLKDKVVIRYSLSDLSQIYVFYKNQFLCAAKPVEKVNPMASESDSPKDMEAVKEVLRLKKKVKNTTRKLCDLLDSKAAGQIDWSRAKRPEIAETIQKIEADKKPKVIRMSPFVEEVDSASQSTGVPPAPLEEIRRTELSGPIFEHDFERYEWYRAQAPDALNRADQGWIADYLKTDEWQRFYGKKYAAGGEKE